MADSGAIGAARSPPSSFMLTGMRLAEVSDQNLRSIGAHLDLTRFPNDPASWREFATRRFRKYFPGGFSTDCQLEEISRRGNEHYGTCGYELLRVLADYNVEVEQLVRELKEVGLTDALQFILPPCKRCLLIDVGGGGSFQDCPFSASSWQFHCNAIVVFAEV